MARARASVVEIMLRPNAAYRELAASDAAATWRDALGGPASFSLLMGCVVSLTTTTRLVPRLAASAAVLWSFPAVLQTLAATVLLTWIAPGRLPLRRGLALYWRGAGPWALWLLAVAALFAWAPVERGGVLQSALVPIVWSGAILVGFLRALGLEGRRLAGAFAVHAALTWGVVVAFFLASDQLLPRILWAARLL